MKTKHIFAVLTMLSAAIFTSFGQNYIDATNSGSWGDPTIWDSGTVPGTNDFVEIDPGISITVDTNAIVLWIVGDGLAGGTLTMATNSTLEILDSSVSGTYQLGLLDTSASGNTVIYDGNPFYAKHCDYYNLVFSNNITTNTMDFYNGYVGALDPSMPMTIHGNMTVIGKTKVQEGDNFTILGNLLLDTNAEWDCSVTNLTVMGTTTLGSGALLFDLDAAAGVNTLVSNVTVSATALGWNLEDVTNWNLGGNLTNNGNIVGKAFGSIDFYGTGSITGSKAIIIPTMTVSGTYFIGTTITLTTNTPTLNGTLVFDLAQTNQIVLKYSPSGTNVQTTQTFYYGGNLNVINSGVPPVSGNNYQFFSASNYAGAFASETFPGLAPGLSWVDNTLTSGSIAVTGAVLGSPTLTLSRSGAVLTLSWDSTSYPGYSVQAQTNNAGVRSNWFPTGSGTVSPYPVTINPANPPVFYRLLHP
jgi:hypothetical protein